MKHFMHLFGFSLVLTTLIGCTSSGRFSSSNLTNVELSESNFHVIATNVYGEASAGYLLGLSFAGGGEMQTLALISLGGDRMLYKVALENLWHSFEQTNGSIKGRSLALVNVRYDSDALNVLVYTKPKISVRADVIEFID